MNRIKEVIKKKSKEYHQKRVFCEHQVKYFIGVLLILIAIGLFVEYSYYSTIGYLGNKIAFEILKIHVMKLVVILGYAWLNDLILSLIVRTTPKSIKQAIAFPLKRPTFLFTLLLVLMLSLDGPISVFCVAITAIAIFSQNTKKGHTFYRIHPILIGYFISVLGILFTNNNLGLIELPPMLTAPYVEVINPLNPLTYPQFKSTYYSLATVIFGIFEGSLCFTLIIPLIVCALFLIKRKMIDYKLLTIYLGIYTLIGIGLGLVFHHPYWITVLFLLNGSVLVTGIFLLSDLVILESYQHYKYVYSVILGLLSALLCYFVDFMAAPYLALAIIQLLMWLFDEVNKIIHSKK